MSSIRYRDLGDRELSAFELLEQVNALKLKRRASSAAARNPIIAGTYSGVTVTSPASAAATLTQQVVLPANVSGVTATPDIFTVRGGTPTQFPAQGYMLFPVSSNAPASGNLSGYLPATPTLSAWTWEVSFMSDAPLMEITFLASATSNFRVVIDGQYATSSAIAPNAYSGMQRIRLDFSSVRQSRLIQFRARGIVGFRGVSMSPIDTIWAAPTDDEVVAAFTGDSFSEGLGVSSPFDPDAAYPHQLGHLMGWQDIRQVAVGSTGYIADGAAARSRLRAQIPRWGITPDVIVCAAGYNDSSFAISDVSAEAGRVWRDMRRAHPKARIFVVAPWVQARGTASVPLENALRAEFVGWDDPLSHFIPVATDTPPWNTGSGHVGATTGTGNSDVYTNNDNTHPSNAGHAYIATRMAATIRTIINAL